MGRSTSSNHPALKLTRTGGAIAAPQQGPGKHREGFSEESRAPKTFLAFSPKDCYASRRISGCPTGLNPRTHRQTSRGL